MDMRNALPSGTELHFPGMCCCVENEIGRGSNAIVYKGYYRDASDASLKHHVLIKELFPFVQEGKIVRLADNSIQCDEVAQPHYHLHRLSFERGNQSHLRLLENSPDQLGANLNTFSLHGTLYTVLGFNHGQSLAGVIGQEREATLRAHVIRMQGMLRALRAFHDADSLHLDISPDNVLVLGQGDTEQILLIDFNSVHTLQELRSGEPLYYSLKEGYTAPEVRSGRLEQIGKASDLYSAAAVFYRMIAGKTLTQAQMLRRTPPDVSECACVRAESPSAASMVKHILRRGLSVLPQARYQSLEEMLQDLKELLDRIEGVGVTHWALWEAGKRTVSRLIRTNPSMGHLRGESTLLPLRCRTRNGEVQPVQGFVDEIASPQGKSALLTAPGGMGKTTALLKAVEQHTSAFSVLSTAVVYIPLYRYNRQTDGGQYIMNRVLEELRFSADIACYEDARHALSLLLDQPLKSRTGDKPMLLLLLDGLNEAEGDISLLVQEMSAMSEKRGVRLLVTSRSDMRELPFERIELMTLETADVKGELNRYGLLMPENEQFCQLLHTPLMLSIFVRTARAEEKQLNIRTPEELLKAYFDAMLSKAQRELPEQSDQHWQLEAAVRLVLPGIAQALAGHAGALNHDQLLSHIQRCYNLLSSRQIRRLFPAWTGHLQSIRGGAANAEEWFGLMVHELLWQQLGLVERDAQGCYRTNHQIINDYLAQVYRTGIGRAVRRRSFLRISAVTAVILMLLTAGIAGTVISWRMTEPEYVPVPYPETESRAVFEHAVVRYGSAMRTALEMDRLITAATKEMGKPQGEAAGSIDYGQLTSNELTYENSRRSWLGWVQMADYSILDPMIQPKVKKMLEGGEVMPWSGRPFHAQGFQMMTDDCTTRLTAYKEYADVLDFLVTHPHYWKYYDPQFTGLLQELVNTDMQILSTLYQLVCMPHELGLAEYDAGFYETLILDTVTVCAPADLYSSAEGMDTEALMGQLHVLMNERSRIEADIVMSGILTIYKQAK